MAARAPERLGFVGHAAKVAGFGIALAGSAWLMGVALQSPVASWLAWFTLIPLFYAIRVLAPWRALLAGAFWGLSLGVFGGAPSFTSSIPTLALLAAVPGLYAFAGSFVTRRAGFSPLLLGLGWIGVELALQPLGLRNGLLAGTQGQGLIVRTMGYLAGYVVVAFIVAYVNALLLSMLSDACTPNGWPRVLPRSTRSPGRLIPSELPAFLLHLFSPSRPRAPPGKELLGFRFAGS